MADEITVEDLLAEIKPRTATARILLNQDLVAEHARLDAELRSALDRDQRNGAGLDTDTPELARRVQDLEGEMDAARRPFTFKAIGRRRWQNLLMMHPPTKDQKHARPGLDHNPETFPLAAIEASCIAPVLTNEAVAALADALAVNQFDQLWAACLDANVGGSGDTPKSLVAGGIARASAAFAS